MKSGPPQRTDKDAIPGCVPHPGLALVTGSKIYKSRPDRRALFEHAIGVDIEDGEGVDLVHDLEQPFPFDLVDVKRFDHIDCVSTLEHVRRPWLAAKNLQDVLISGGTIFVGVPFAWRIHAYPDDYYRFSPAAMPILFDEIEWTHLLYFSQRDGLTVEYPKTTKDNPYNVPRCETYAWGVKR